MKVQTHLNQEDTLIIFVMLLSVPCVFDQFDLKHLDRTKRRIIETATLVSHLMSTSHPCSVSFIVCLSLFVWCSAEQCGKPLCEPKWLLAWIERPKPSYSLWKASPSLTPQPASITLTWEKILWKIQLYCFTLTAFSCAILHLLTWRSQQWNGVAEQLVYVILNPWEPCWVVLLKCL